MSSVSVKPKYVARAERGALTSLLPAQLYTTMTEQQPLLFVGVVCPAVLDVQVVLSSIYIHIKVYVASCIQYVFLTSFAGGGGAAVEQSSRTPGQRIVLGPLVACLPVCLPAFACQPASLVRVWDCSCL